MRLDRRLNRKLVTRNTEYHIHMRECVGVRDRRTGKWLTAHPALRAWLLGGMDRKERIFAAMRPGVRLVFTDGKRDVLTSPLLSVDRPERPALESYTWRGQTGYIEAAA
ncbi:MAG: hypothetical protein RBU30_01655 [Polyangia bacterium]|jgi:hypothetical protein|nr:hypothetical protein [Polyangia bacterium]